MKKKEIAFLNEENIKNKIYNLRGLKVMLDKDLADLYEVKPIRLREQVKRNIERFPSDFMFALTEKEVDAMVSQNAIPSRKNLGGHLPFVFTEQGVAALSGVLKSKRAIEVNIKVMRAFVSLRRVVTQNAEVFQRLGKSEQRLLEHDNKFEQVFRLIEDKNLKPEKGIFFEGQIFDAYRFVSDLVRSANNSIILIDNFIDESIFVLFSKRRKEVKVIIYTKLNQQSSLDLEKFNAQYEPIEIKEFTKSHDRFMIIDNKEVYHFGASLKDLGKKWFAFSRFDKDALNLLGRL